MKHTILCVDDEIDNVDALERLLRPKYAVLKATSGKEALKFLDQNRVSVIISDQRMPKMTGVELFKQSLKTHPDAIRILLTGYADIEVVIEAINSGHVYRYLNKPWDPIDLVNTIDKAVDRYEIGIELKEKNIALTSALEELKALDEAKNQFMVLINHELKTPLTTILSFSELLNETSLDDDQKKFLSRIQTATGRLERLVTDSLELISAETNQTKLHIKPIKATDLVSKLAPQGITKRLFEENSLTLENHSSSGASVLADSSLIHNVLIRLFDNAVKFAKPRSTIVIETSDEAGENETGVRIKLENKTNNANAFTPEKTAALTKPFTLNENSLNHSNGTGLGLSICQAILKLHQSRLSFATTKDSVAVSFVLKAKPSAP